MKICVRVDARCPKTDSTCEGCPYWKVYAKQGARPEWMAENKYISGPGYESVYGDGFEAGNIAGVQALIAKIERIGHIRSGGLFSIYLEVWLQLKQEVLV